jgi:catechol 2,3-dioxygenase-like lactoylglutathione lyase family enzyme
MDVRTCSNRNITMLDHIILTVSNLPRSIAFYSKALAPLGITDVLDYKGRDGHPDLTGFGRGNNFFFWLKGGEPSPAAAHFAFVAESRAMVDAFYAAALAAGARDNISPRIRHEYHANYYAADVFDPDGYSVEVVIKTPSAE